MLRTIWSPVPRAVQCARPVLVALACLVPVAAGCAGGGPGPLPPGAWERAGPGPVCESEWTDFGRQRQVPVRIRMPAGPGSASVILFSHGLGGSLDAGTEWARAWVEAGFAVVHLQHPGSDASVMEGVPPGQRLDALRSGMGGRQLIERARDVSFVLDELAEREAEGACDLSRIDGSRVGMAGHSFGAHTTQAVAGQAFGRGLGGRQPLGEPRIDAAVAFSPAPPRGTERTVRAAFAEVEIPFFSITGTADEVPELTEVSASDRTLPFRYMPPGDKYLLVFEEGDHAAFSGNTVGRRRGPPPDPGLVDAVQASTTAFWRAMLLGDEEAREWLEEGGPESMLRPGDRFERK